MFFTLIFPRNVERTAFYTGPNDGEGERHSTIKPQQQESQVKDSEERYISSYERDSL